jgi:acetyl-CoA acetyltransferase
VGIGESPYYRAGYAKESEFQLAAIAILAAVADAGLEIGQIDGFVGFANDRNVPSRLATALGVDLTRFGAATWDGGGQSAAATLMLADAAVTMGYARHVVCFRSLAQGQFGRFGQLGSSGDRAAGPDAYRRPYGLTAPAHQFAMIARRFMYEHDISQDALMEISLASYAHAQRNPRAVRYGRGITERDYRESRLIVEPYHLYDCCQENDGASAVIVTSAERARDLAKQPVYIRSVAQGMGHRGHAGGGLSGPEFPTAHLRSVARDLWERAEIGPSDVQVAQFYENFTGMVVIAMVEMGIAPADEIEQWLKGGNARWPHGRMPINTSGGNLAEAYIHGFQLINEAVRQVRGESVCQVVDVENSLVVAGPGALPTSAAVLSRHP